MQHGRSMSLSNFLAPKFTRREFAKTVGLTLAGALVAGGYGILHDQITYTLSPEYFTLLKFAQFRQADFGFSERVLVAEIGFLATWWVGLIASWFLVRLAVPRCLPDELAGVVGKAWCWMLGSAVACGALGHLLGPSSLLGDPQWKEAIHAIEVKDSQAFAQVAGIHVGGYLGALAGWLLAMARLLRKPRLRQR